MDFSQGKKTVGENRASSHIHLQVCLCSTVMYHLLINANQRVEIALCFVDDIRLLKQEPPPVVKTRTTLSFYSQRYCFIYVYGDYTEKLYCLMSHTHYIIYIIII